MRVIAALSLGLLIGSSGCASSGDATGAVGGQGATAGGSSVGGANTGGTGASSSGGSGTGTGATSSGGSSTGSSTGGSATSGGSGGTSTGGSAGGPPHVVGNCTGLGAVDHFDDVTPPGLKSTQLGVATVAVDPVHSGTLLVGTDHHGIMKSTDCGASWAKLDTGRGSAALDGGTLYTVMIDPVDPNLVFAAALYSSDSSLYRSTNGGVDFDTLFPAGSLVAQTVEYNFFQSMGMDPGDHRHLIVTFHANCKGDYAPSCLGESTDSGVTWRLFKSPLSGWSEGASSIVFGPTSWVLGTGQNGVYYTSDSGAHWSRVASGAYGQCPYRASDGYLYAGSDYGLMRTRDGSQWDNIPKTFQCVGVGGDGIRLFSNSRSDPHPFYTTPETDGLTWTALPSSPAIQMSEHFAYDSDHHVMYSSHRDQGLLRVVTH